MEQLKAGAGVPNHVRQIAEDVVCMIQSICIELYRKLARLSRVWDDMDFFQSVRAALSDQADGVTCPQREFDLAVRQITPYAVASEDLVDIFAAV